MDDVQMPIGLRIGTEPFRRETFLYLRAGRLRAAADGTAYG
ncbi:hypothetical protein [Streptomyces sp. NPDC046939]